MSEQSSSSFSATVEFLDDLSVVRAFGEIDIASAPSFALHLSEAASRTPAVLLIDLSSVSFLDSTGLGVLIDQLEQLKAQTTPTDLRLVVREPQVLKVFAVTGLDGVFSIFPTEQAALGATA